MRWNRLVAGVLAAALALTAAAGAAVAAEHPQPAPGRAGQGMEEKKPAKPLARTVRGLLVQDAEGYVLIQGRLAYRVVPQEGVDLAPHVLKFVVARVAAQDGQWIVTAVRRSAHLRFVQPPAPKAEKAKPPASGQPPQEGQAPQQGEQPPEQGQQPQEGQGSGGGGQ